MLRKVHSQTCKATVAQRAFDFNIGTRIPMLFVFHCPIGFPTGANYWSMVAGFHMFFHSIAGIRLLTERARNGCFGTGILVIIKEYELESLWTTCRTLDLAIGTEGMVLGHNYTRAGVIATCILAIYSLLQIILDVRPRLTILRIHLFFA